MLTKTQMSSLALAARRNLVRWISRNNADGSHAEEVGKDLKMESQLGEQFSTPTVVQPASELKTGLGEGSD